MGKYTFRIDNKDPLYKKLIKLPTAYYRLKSSSSKYTIDSHIGTVEVESISDLKLQKRDEKIVLCEGDTPLKLNGSNFIIEQEDIIGENRDNIIEALESGKVIKALLQKIKDSPYFGIELFISRKNPARGVLNFINFYGENDPVLKKIIEEKGGLYFTIEGNNIYISDKDGNCLPAYDDYQY